MPPINPLKRLRNGLRLAQAEVAARMKVSQPNYQRWESGAAPIPVDKIEKLAKVLHTTPEVIRGESRYSRAGYGTSDDYWGEAAIHFKSGAEPFLVSITGTACTKLQVALQARESAFISLEGLCNEHYFIRTSAVSEVYLTDEAGDEIGASNFDYPYFVPIQLVDSRLWDVLSSFNLELEDSGFPIEDTVEALSHFMTMKQIEEYLDPDDTRSMADSRDLKGDRVNKALLRVMGIPSTVTGEESQEVLKERKKFLLDRASHTLIRLSSGQERRLLVTESEDVTACIDTLSMLEPGEEMSVLFSFPDEAQVAMFQAQAMDFIRFPKHFLDRAADGIDMNVYAFTDEVKD